jgi:hypothetical protein
MDINPYSIINADDIRIRSKIIANCLNPPLMHTPFFICNNLLHHVTNKREVLSNWSNCTNTAIFNENTSFWASSWTLPFILEKIGMKKLAYKKAKSIERKSMQSLLKKDELSSLVGDFFEIENEHAYFHKNTFFVCSIFSFFLRAYGPPTPPFQKFIFLKIIPWIAVPFTKSLAKELLKYDSFQEENGAVFISWFVSSKTHRRFSLEVEFKCPECGEKLICSKKCLECNTSFETRNGMLFLLNRKMSQEIKYENKDFSLGKEHL